ncbi:MAG TPA: TorF family putative porin [Dehalococcoidia bacterium]|jgi:uncharacterized protein (TIGR02001 family)|nr:TorF family putative porin [Dehalococcoidia bacterium]
MSIIKSVSLGAATLLAAAVLAGPSFADGLPGRGRVKAPETRTGPCATTANVGLTSDYVFRGISQTNEEAAVQGGVDLTCGKFYAGVWASSFFGDEGSTEIDLYAGFRTSTGKINWDLGFIYYTYPGSFGGDGNYLELKAGASGELWKGGTLGGTVFYSPDYNGTLGATWTLEGSLSQTLPRVGMFTPTFGATVGHTYFDDKLFGLFDLDYTYWNVGVTLGFQERWSLDLRYWGTDGEGLADSPLGDDRFVATVKYTF